MPASPGAAELLRSVGLLADGPVRWDRPLPAIGAGVFVVELAASLATAPMELTTIGKWIETVPTLRLDGERPSSRVLAARLAAFWIPSSTVVYVGASDTSVGRRVAAIAATPLGQRRPNPAGHWLHALRSLEGARVWWAATAATEEYEDALLSAFADAIPVTEREALPDRDVVLPFANLRRPTGERKATGLTGAIVAEPVAAPPPTRIVQLPDGDADGARGEPPAPKARTPAPAPRPRSASASSAKPATGGPSAAPDRSTPPDTSLTREGEARLRAELDELMTVRRPAVIARIRTAKEHGDLKENAEYHAAREEQSFLEGRIQAIEARLRTAVIVDAPSSGSRVGLGSVVTITDDEVTLTWTIVGASESAPGAGRISSASPVGRALVGHDVGDEVVVSTPGGDQRYRIVAIE